MSTAPRREGLVQLKSLFNHREAQLRASSSRLRKPAAMDPLRPDTAHSLSLSVSPSRAADTASVVQGQFTPQSRRHLGFDDVGGDWLEETIGNVVMQRFDTMRYSLSDGDNAGPIKHYVPYNWIMKNIADHLVIGNKRHTVIARLADVLEPLGLQLPGSYPENPADFDTLVRDSVYMICDWEQNLFRHQASSGDAGGTQLDVPADPLVLARVQAAAVMLGSLAGAPLA